MASCSSLSPLSWTTVGLLTLISILSKASASTGFPLRMPWRASLEPSLLLACSSTELRHIHLPGQQSHHCNAPRIAIRRTSFLLCAGTMHSGQDPGSSAMRRIKEKLRIQYSDLHKCSRHCSNVSAELARVLQQLRALCSCAAEAGQLHADARACPGAAHRRRQRHATHWLF